jgi:choline-glycine betaine transporter
MKNGLFSNNRRSKKGAFTIGDLSGIAITLVILAIILGIGATILDSIQDTQTADGYAYNSTQEGLKGLKTLSDYQTVIALVAVAAVVVGIVLAFFGRGAK